MTYSVLAMPMPDEFLQALVERVADRLEERAEGKRFLSKDALALHLGVSPRRIKTLRERGLPARKVGRDLYFDLEEVNEWIQREGAM